MRKIKVLLVLFFATVTFANAQLDCSGTLSKIQVAYPFKLSSMSKSAVCVSGHTYEFVVPLKANYQYRFLYYASSAFNNDINFKMIDLNTNKEIINLPGYSDTNEKGTAVLSPYFDKVTGDAIHPFFDVLPSSSTSVKVVIDINDMPDIIKGCVTVVVLDKEFGTGGFE